MMYSLPYFLHAHYSFFIGSFNQLLPVQKSTDDVWLLNPNVPTLGLLGLPALFQEGIL